MKRIISRITSFAIVTALAVSLSTVAFAQGSQSATATKAIDLKEATVSRVVGPYLMSYNNDTRLPMGDSDEDDPYVTDSAMLPAPSTPPAPPVNTKLDDIGLVNTIPTKLGNITLSDDCEMFSDDYYSFFEYKYNTKYFCTKDTVTLTMPEGVKAIGFRVISESVNSAKITAKTNDGTTLTANYIGEDSENSLDKENGIAFYSETSDIKTITISYDQNGFDGFALGDIYINSIDIRTLFTKTHKTATGENFAPGMLKSVNINDLFMKLIKEYAILKDIKLTHNGKAVTEAKEAGSYDLVLTVDNIDQQRLCSMLDELYNVDEPTSLNKIGDKFGFDVGYRLAVDRQGYEKISGYINNMINSNGYSDKVLSTSTIVIKDFIKLNTKAEVISEDKTPLAPVDNPKTGAPTVAVTLILVALAAVTTKLLFKKKDQDK